MRFITVFIVLLVVSCSSPVTIQTKDKVAIFDLGCEGFSFARSGNTWGVLWTKTHKIDTGQLDITLFCREEPHFDLFDDELKPKLEKPIKLLRRKCQTYRYYKLLATEDGFAITYLNGGNDSYAMEDLKYGGELRYAVYDLKTARFTDKKPLLSKTSGEVLTADSLLHKTLSTFYHNGTIFIGMKKENAIKVVAVRQGEKADDLFSLDIPRTYRPAFSGYFGGPVLFAWTQTTAIPGYSGKVVYALSVNGKRIDRREDIMEYNEKDSYNIDLAVLKNPDNFSIIVHKGKEIWQQLFDFNGSRLGIPELLVTEEEGVYNFNASSSDSGSIIFFTAGKYLKYYSCSTKKLTTIGNYFNVSMGCAGRECIYSTNSDIRLLKL